MASRSLHKTVTAAGVSQNGLPSSGVLTSNRFGSCSLGTELRAKTQVQGERGVTTASVRAESLRPMLPASVPQVGERL